MASHRKLINFFVYSNLFIAGCALAMAWHSYHLLLHTAPHAYFMSFVFFATMCSYSFHWYLTTDSVLVSPRTQWQRTNRNLHLVFFMTGLAGACLFLYFLLPHWPWLVVSAIITFLYSAPKIPHPYFRMLRKVALGKTIFLAFVWTYVTSMLPLLISGVKWKPDYYLFVASRFFLIYAICILFDYRDREDDKAHGIRSLITLLNEKGITNLFTVSILVFAVATVSMLFFGYSIVTILILLLPGIITAAVYNYARTNFSDMFYYLALDGLMALSAILALLTGI
jgi:4-hydroxybenzoate polyprenyltransferase